MMFSAVLIAEPGVRAFLKRECDVLLLGQQKAAPKDRQAEPGLNVNAAPQLAGASVRPSFEISAGILVYCMHIAARSVQADIA